MSADPAFAISNDLLGFVCHSSSTDTKNPALPTLNIFDDNKNEVKESNEASQVEDLITRLSNTLKTLEKYEQITNAPWNLDAELCHINEDINASPVELPQHVEEQMKAIIQSAQEYINELNAQLKSLDTADQQIEDNMVNALEQIDKTWQSFMREICQTINKRREALRLETQIRKNEGLIPLRACRQEVKAQVRSTENLITAVNTMLKYPHNFTRDRFAKIVNATSNIGRVPEVPYSEEIPSITFHRPSNTIKDEILERISKLGWVSRASPVQILNIEERPASLFVNWYITDADCSGEEHIFIVQKAVGEVLDPTLDAAFETVYEGPETHCFIRDLPISQPVTLRVGIQVNDMAWSVHRTAQTTMRPYHWQLDNPNYVITNNARVAAKLTDIPSTLFSDNTQVDANQVIEFTFLEVCQKVIDDDEGIALTRDRAGSTDNLKRRGSLLITVNGNIFMDGKRKSMQLPKMHFGTSIIITAMRRDINVLRVNIECMDKCVTYDWSVETPLYFAARFTKCNKWNLMVK